MTIDDLLSAMSVLDQAVGELEQLVEQIATQANGQQRDLFGNVIALMRQPESKVDTTAITKRLDQAISRVQQILKEAA